MPAQASRHPQNSMQQRADRRFDDKATKITNSLDKIIKLLVHEGYNATIISINSTPAIETMSQGYKWNILFYECDAKLDCKSMEFRAAFAPKQRVDLSVINNWNSVNRFAYGYYTKENMVYLEMDIPNCTNARVCIFAEFLGLWNSKMASFVKAISSN